MVLKFYIYQGFWRYSTVICGASGNWIRGKNRYTSFKAIYNFVRSKIWHLIIESLVGFRVNVRSGLFAREGIWNKALTFTFSESELNSYVTEPKLRVYEFFYSSDLLTPFLWPQQQECKPVTRFPSISAVFFNSLITSASLHILTGGRNTLRFNKLKY